MIFFLILSHFVGSLLFILLFIKIARVLFGAEKPKYVIGGYGQITAQFYLMLRFLT